MNGVAKFIVRRAWLVLVGIALLLAAAVGVGWSPQPEDDILSFLPPEDPDVRVFRKISATFGGLEVAMVGIETPDVFTPGFLRRLDGLTQDLRDTHGIDRVVSLTNLADFEPDKVKRGMKAGELVDVRRFPDGTRWYADLTFGTVPRVAPLVAKLKGFGAKLEELAIPLRGGQHYSVALDDGALREGLRRAGLSRGPPIVLRATFTFVAARTAAQVTAGLTKQHLQAKGKVSQPGSRYLPDLRIRVLSKDHVVGQFVDRKGKATLVLAFLVPGQNQKAMVGKIRRAVKRHMPQETIFWGGAPFIAAYIYETTSNDIKTLTPFALLAIVLVMLFSFRDPLGVVLSLLSTAVGVIVAFSLMVLFDVKLNLVLSSMPVILFAVGSAYGIHILNRYYILREQLTKRLGDDADHREAVWRAVADVGPAVIATGLTTIAGFISFLVMDIRPMRQFGLFTAIGIGVTVLTALAFIPAVLSVAGKVRLFRGRQGESWLTRGMAALAAGAARRRVLMIAGGLIIGGVGIYMATRVKVEVEPSAFFAEGSEPDLADKFMSRRFGGAQFVQVHFDLDPRQAGRRSLARAFSEMLPEVRDRSKPQIQDPLVLREVRRFAEKVAALPDVSQALHVGLPVSMGTELITDLRRIPDTSGEVKNVYGLVSTDPMVNRLINYSRRDLLLHIKVRSSRVEVVSRVMKQVDGMLRDRFRHRFERVVLRDFQDYQVCVGGEKPTGGSSAGGKANKPGRDDWDEDLGAGQGTAGQPPPGLAAAKPAPKHATMGTPPAAKPPMVAAKTAAKPGAKPAGKREDDWDDDDPPLKGMATRAPAATAKRPAMAQLAAMAPSKKPTRGVVGTPPAGVDGKPPAGVDGKPPPGLDKGDDWGDDDDPAKVVARKKGPAGGGGGCPILRREQDEAKRKAAIAVLVGDTADHLLARARGRGVRVAGKRAALIGALTAQYGKPPAATARAQREIAKNLTSYLLSGEFAGSWPARDFGGKAYDRTAVAERIARAVAALGPNPSDARRDAAVARAGAGILLRRPRGAIPLSATARGFAQSIGAYLRPAPGAPPTGTDAAKSLAGYLLGATFTTRWPPKDLNGNRYDRTAVAGRIAAAVTGLGAQAAPPALEAAVRKATAGVLAPRPWPAVPLSATAVGFSGFLPREIESSWRRARGTQIALAAAAALGVAAPTGRLLKALRDGGLDLDAPTAALPVKQSAAAGSALLAVRPTVSGMPVVLRGLARSVEKNQILSLAVSLGIVLLIMIIMFRSFLGGLVALLPAAVTLLAVFGGMGLTGKRLDIGTSMVAGIALGVGIDYAIHFLSWWRADRTGAKAARAAALESGGGILANAVMVSAGFVVLAMGDAEPLKMFGLMVGVAMVVAALVTFLLVPATAGNRTYGKHSRGDEGLAADVVPAEMSAGAERVRNR